MKLESVERMSTSTTIINDYFIFISTRLHVTDLVLWFARPPTQNAHVFLRFAHTSYNLHRGAARVALHIPADPVARRTTYISLRLRGNVPPIIRVLMVQAPSGLPHDKSFMSVGCAKREEILWATSKLRLAHFLKENHETGLRM